LVIITAGPVESTSAQVHSPDRAQPSARELTSERTENTKCFDNPDGSRTYLVSSGPLHYGKSGQWHDIDTQLRPSTRGDNSFEMTRSVYQAHFQSSFDSGRIVKLTRDGHALTIQPGQLYWINDRGERQCVSAPRPTPAVADGSLLRYKDAYGPGIDFVYETNDVKVAKRLTLQSFYALPAPTPYMKAGGNVHLALDVTFQTDSKLEDGYEIHRSRSQQVLLASSQQRQHHR
jgi:hypothetical protein